MTESADGVAGGDQPTDEAVEAAKHAYAAWRDNVDFGVNRMRETLRAAYAVDRPAVCRVRANDEALVERIAEVLLADYASEYDAGHLTWRDFADPAKRVIAVLPEVRADTPTDESEELASVRAQWENTLGALGEVSAALAAAVAAAAEARAEADKRVNDAWEAARSDFRKGVLSSLTALDEARAEAGQ